ncbi:metallophosphoesterase family protein [uncultured Roseobacter sp.]|uniref:metallophosphoesterase family protein n=1 Tax=uncultured Roseobacter sp. TaxID=114847 RepID=UPI0026313EFA|nr:metallophosphoesterase family protein [uncultured Roseobacter sp.]
MLQDLGVIDDPVMLFGGPCSNADATRALFDEASARGIKPAHMICTGDVVAYCGAPDETLALIRGAGIPVVAGNCEKQLASGAGDCGCGFEEGSVCDLLSAGWYSYANARVSAQDRAWMAQCPDAIVFTHQGARYAVIHGGVTDIARFVWPDSPDAVFEQEWRALEAVAGAVDHVIAGHCGIPFIRETDRGRWINAGIIGVPPHDGRQQTRCAILDGGDVLFHHLSYDASRAAERMIKAGLVQGYERALLSGYWPSEDVLPVSLRVPSLASG